jgi:phospholipid/cholesterol/gamma-HCH transport system permease protein
MVGLVMAHHSAAKFEEYGATIYVTDVVVLSMTRELGPPMTAIILAGRSGAAYTAELATMKVSEEIDALRTMGFGPVRHLALPRVLALLWVTRLLTLMADLVGCAGGMFMAALNLDITPRAFINEAMRALKPSDIWTGLVKSAVFAVAIAIIACERGFATRGGAAEVGGKTTSTVVTCLFALVLLDAGLTVFFLVLLR